MISVLVACFMLTALSPPPKIIVQNTDDGTFICFTTDDARTLLELRLNSTGWLEQISALEKLVKTQEEKENKLNDVVGGLEKQLALTVEQNTKLQRDLEENRSWFSRHKFITITVATAATAIAIGAIAFAVN